MPSLPRPRVARLAALPLLAAASACRISDGPYEGQAHPRISLSVEMLDAGDTVPPLTAPYAYQVAGVPVRLAPAGGIVIARGHLWPGATNGRRRRVTDGRLIVNGVALDGRIPSGQQSIEYVGEVGARPADGVATVVLPRIDGIAPVTLRLEGVGRAAGTAVQLTGSELRLRVVPPATRIAPPLNAPHWSVTLTRGDRRTTIDGSTTLTPELVLPVASILPGTGPITARLLYHLNVESLLLRPTPTDTTYGYGVTLVSSLRFAPVTP